MVYRCKRDKRKDSATHHVKYGKECGQGLCTHCYNYYRPQHSRERYPANDGTRKQPVAEEEAETLEKPTKRAKY